MDERHLKLIDVTIHYLQFMSTLFLIVLTACGSAFYYYWTTRPSNSELRDFWPFSLPSSIVLIALIFAGHIYGRLITALAEGYITKYVLFWLNWVGIIQWCLFFLSVLALVFLFIKIHRR